LQHKYNYLILQYKKKATSVSLQSETIGISGQNSNMLILFDFFVMFQYGTTVA